MKQLYRLLLLCACLSALPAAAQQWRPFRPNGDVHAFRGASADTVLTLRLDSAAVAGTDSVYFFNRILRRANGAALGLGANWQKSRNNQFGTQMRYNVAQRTYVLYWNGGVTNGFSLDRALVLKPFVPVGTTWSSAYTDYGVQTTLLSRGTALIDGVQDSIATFQVNRSLTVVLSKHYGLVSAPKDLAFGLPAPKMLTLARRPAAAGQSYYNPLLLLDLQPRDELGYYADPMGLSMFPCFNSRMMRSVTCRVVTADSIVYTFLQQSKTTYNGFTGCQPAGSTLSPITASRAAASLRTGRWAGSSLNYLLPTGTDLLAYEYRSQSAGVLVSVLMGYPVVPGQTGSACGGPAALKQAVKYQIANGLFYDDPAVDAPGWYELVAAGVGVVKQSESQLVYARRTVNGAVQICGTRSDFATILSAKAAPALVPLQLYPNPAGSSALLTVPAATGAATVRLLDGLGRIVSTQPLAAGQHTATVDLHGLATGVYVVEVLTPGSAPQHVRLQHQQ
jgi:hypothetical protein